MMKRSFLGDFTETRAAIHHKIRIKYGVKIVVDCSACNRKNTGFGIILSPSRMLKIKAVKPATESGFLSVTFKDQTQLHEISTHTFFYSLYHHCPGFTIHTSWSDQPYNSQFFGGIE
jgi:hypothetical protein